MGLRVVSAFNVVRVQREAHAQRLLEEAGEPVSRARDVLEVRWLVLRVDRDSELDVEADATELQELSCAG